MIDRKKIAEKLRKIAEDCAISGSIAVYKTNAALYAAADELDPPEPQPLLADAKVGDLCQRRDGKWVQIDAIRNNGNKWSIFEAEGRSYHESGNAVCSELYHTKFDIIHTEPLAPEGSAEWAWQMLKIGKPVTNKRVFTAGGYIKATCSDKYHFVQMWGYSGWQLYEEPKPEPEPKPLLADAQAGDLCKHRNGDWSQIIDTNGTYIPGQPIRTTLKDTIGTNRNFCLSGSHFTMQFGGEYDIIATEPLAPEGSAEWAWQMRLLGNKVSHPSGLLYAAETFAYDDNESVYRQNWLCDKPADGWQLYKEPEPPREPDSTQQLEDKMIKFETINGTLCRMVEPTPLQLDGEFPCVVRLIQDDSRLGILNKLLHEGCYHEIYLCTSCNNQVCHILINGEEYDDYYPKYEIIGYPVVDGSHWWALYQMMQGDKVIANINYYSYYHIVDGMVYFSGNDMPETQEDWLEKRIKNSLTVSWQIYSKPKPLLADAKVGDLCKRRDGRYCQITDVIDGFPKLWKTANLEFHTSDGVCYPICTNPDNTSPIIATEPLAEVGSIDRALQDMKLGKRVKLQQTMFEMRGGKVWKWKISHSGALIGQYPVQSLDEWYRLYRGYRDIGWQLYEEPEPFKVGDWAEYRFDSRIYYGEINDIRDHAYYLSFTTEDIPPDQARAIRLENITRKINPSEVVIHIGCLSGTVEKAQDYAYFLLWHSKTDCDYSMIKWSAIDTPTRELVESLLKAQEEK